MKMVRINLVSPRELTDQHLCAENVELKMWLRAYCNGRFKSDVPSKFVMGAGHQLFFKDKVEYIVWRRARVQQEMLKRGFTVNDACVDINDPRWKPTDEDINLIRERLKEKIAMKPDWYRYYGEPLKAGFFNKYPYYTKL